MIIFLKSLEIFKIQAHFLNLLTFYKIRKTFTIVNIFLIRKLFQKSANIFLTCVHFKFHNFVNILHETYKKNYRCVEDLSVVVPVESSPGTIWAGDDMTNHNGVGKDLTCLVQGGRRQRRMSHGIEVWPRWRLRQSDPSVVGGAYGCARGVGGWVTCERRRSIM